MRISIPAVVAIALTLTTASCRGGGPDDPRVSASVAASQKALQRHIFETVISGDMDDLDELYAPGYVYHGPSGEELDLAGVKESNAAYLNAFPDAQVTFDFQIAAGEFVVARGLFTGTHTGDMDGLPPTDKPVSVTLINIQRVVDGKVVEEWESADLLGMMTQLGVLPEM
ncbi:ester cyclase [Rhodocaloribacter sp.]